MESLYDVRKWYASSRALYAGAKTSWERVDILHSSFFEDRFALISVAQMLAGMSLECLFKGILISRIKESDYKPEMPKEMRTHNLVSLVKLLSVHLSDQEKNCLDNLSEYIVWSGRYPAAISYKDHGGKIIISTHREIFFDLYKRFSKRFDITS